MATALVALSQLIACSHDRVVVQPVTMPPVAPDLLARIAKPKCDLAPADAYAPAEIDAARRCEAAGGDLARRRHAALASAVEVREKAARELVTAAKR